MIITAQESNESSPKSNVRIETDTKVAVAPTKQAIIRQVLLYTSVFVLLLSVIAVSYYRPSRNAAEPMANVSPAANSVAEGAVTIDQKTATDIAANFALQTQMPVAPNVANLSTSLEAKKEIAQEDDTIISKPQIIQPASDNRAVTVYKAKTGDTVQSIAEAHGISAQTIKWANDLQSDAVENGRDITILPVDGVVYTAKEGDTVQSIAEKYQALPERIVSFNDLEVGSITNDMRIVVPGGVKPADPVPATPTAIATQPARTATSPTNVAMARASAGNAYALGNCTWYAYERRAQLGRPIGSFWGNASTWAANGAAAGFGVNRTPAPGAIMQNGGGYAGYGHVAIVETMNPDGSITVSEMNYAGFNVVSSRTIPAGQIGNYTYIH